MPLSKTRPRTFWHRVRAHEVAPIGLIVIVAILGIALATFTSARRADEAAVGQERRLLAAAIDERGALAVSQIASVITDDGTAERTQRNLGPQRTHWRVGHLLKTYFKHDEVFIFDAADKLIYASSSEYLGPSETATAIGDEFDAVIDALRGRPSPLGGRVQSPVADPASGRTQPLRVTSIQKFMGRPAIVAAVAIERSHDAVAESAAVPPVVASVLFIDDGFVADLGAHLGLAHLRVGDAGTGSDHSVDLVAHDNGHVATLTWMPSQPGTQILNGMLPFIVVAFVSLALLSGLALRYIHRTAATISAGEDRLRYLALHDALSGLPNRAYFGERLESVIARVRQGGSPAAVFYLDLDHFKEVNDTLGHHVGDELITAVTGRLRKIVRDEALVARLGGDEFAIITPGATDSATLMTIANRIIVTLCRPYIIMGHTILIGASIGIALIDRPSLNAADVMRYADMALYRAKNEGRRRACIYDAAMDADLLQRKMLENDLREAIEKDQLELAYQPIFTADGETVAGVEALTRWQHSQRGEIPPSEFIPSAEHSGLIIPLGEWVLRRACLDAKNWPVALAVNVSPLQFRRPDFVEMVERILAETAFDPSRLELELTESTLLGNVEGAELAMRQLKALGVRLALDDFGTGYSSLLYLRRLPFDKLKIDGSFVRNIESSPEAAPIVHAVVSLGRGLGMKVTAEGVETAEQHLFLRAAGVHFLQGFRFGSAESVSALEARFAVQARQRAASENPVARAG
jgi:diguanylate cyclase (GGDEF)-like protein